MLSRGFISASSSRGGCQRSQLPSVLVSLWEPKETIPEPGLCTDGGGQMPPALCALTPSHQAQAASHFCH